MNISLSIVLPSAICLSCAVTSKISQPDIPSFIMLFRQLGAILGSGVALVAAGPLSHSVRDIPSRPDAVIKRTVPETHVLHERQLPQWTSTWKRSAKVPRDALLPMRIGLKQRNLDAGALMLRDMLVMKPIEEAK